MTTTTNNTVEFGLRELIRAAEMSGLNPQQIPSDVNPWTWDDPRAMSWRSNYRALNPAVAQQAEILLSGPLSLALKAAMEADEARQKVGIKLTSVELKGDHGAAAISIECISESRS